MLDVSKEKAREIYLTIYSEVKDLDENPEDFLRRLPEDEIDQIPYYGPDLSIDAIIERFSLKLPNKLKMTHRKQASEGRALVKAIKNLLGLGINIYGKTPGELGDLYFKLKDSQ